MKNLKPDDWEKEVLIKDFVDLGSESVSPVVFFKNTIAFLVGMIITLVFLTFMSGALGDSEFYTSPDVWINVFMIILTVFFIWLFIFNLVRYVLYKTGIVNKPKKPSFREDNSQFLKDDNDPSNPLSTGQGIGFGMDVDKY